MTKREREGRYDRCSKLSILLHTSVAINPTESSQTFPPPDFTQKARPHDHGDRVLDHATCTNGQGDGGADGNTNLTVAKAAESGTKGAAPGARPFSLKMYAMAAA